MKKKKKKSIYDKVGFASLAILIVFVAFYTVIAVNSKIESHAVDQKFDDDLQKKGITPQEFKKDYEAKTGKKWQENNN